MNMEDDDIGNCQSQLGPLSTKRERWLAIVGVLAAGAAIVAYYVKLFN